MGAMTESSPRERPILAWGVAAAALEGESGDLHAVVPFTDGLLVAVIDGLGHGPEAAAAARAARAILEECAGDPLGVVIERCHEGIRPTRGVVMSVASFDVRGSSMTWAGVGNVEAVLVRAELGRDRAYEAIQSRGGVVGSRLPPLSVRTLLVAAGDLLIMATDGVRHGFLDVLKRGVADPQVIAGQIMAGYAKGSDDALVLVGQYLERAA
jgi:negative regulator of sigma-B (phosphoserine phosphatase)